MAISKHKLSFDPAESDDYDIVASFLKASDGTLLTHTGGALDVNIKTSDITLEVNLDFANDSVDVSGSVVALDAATLAALETITVEQGTSPWVVSATDLDIRDLSASQDNVAISDGTDTLAINSDGSVNIVEAGYSTCNNAAVTVTTSATDVVATELANRKELTIQNVGGKDIYIGCDNTVSLSNGILVPKGATASFKFGDAINVHAIADGASSEIRILELA